MTKVYLAARYSDKDVVKAKAGELTRLGLQVTSRWLDEKSKPTITLKEAKTELGDDELRNIAQQDIEDIIHADYVVLFTIDPSTATVRGGRHFESGFAFALQLLHQYGWLKAKKNWRLITVGPRENIFHYLPDIRNFDSWEECKRYLERISHGEQKDEKQLEFNDAQQSRCCS